MKTTNRIKLGTVTIRPIMYLCITILLLCGIQAHSPTRAHAFEPEWALPGEKFLVDLDRLYDCSVGFPAWDKYHNHYFITAGNCFMVGNTQYYSDVSRNIGATVYDPSDHEAVGYERLVPQYYEGKWINAALVQLYPGHSLSGEGWKNVPKNPVDPEIGDPACFIAFRFEHPSCGHTISGQHQSDVADRATPQTTIATDLCARGGDSGGAVFNEEGALGIVVSGTPYGTCVSEFTPLSLMLKEMRKIIPTLTL